MKDPTQHSPFDSAAPGDRALEAGEVHVWAVSLDGDPAPFDGLLCPSEQDRLARFRFAEHQRRFHISHGALRRILGGYLRQDPREVVFRHGPRGKPFLEGGELSFNLSHSGQLALVAVAAEEVGVDVEKVRRLESLTQIAERHFSDREFAALDELEGDARELAFYRCWTRKEAYIKALGEGLSMALDSFEVSIAAQAAFLACHDGREDPARWSMLDVSPCADYVGAVAARAPDVAVSRLQFVA